MIPRFKGTVVSSRLSFSPAPPVDSLTWRHHGDLEVCQVCQVPDSRLMPEQHKSNLNRLGILTDHAR
eukprot:scaffold142123_cov21-Attheya_sp.AAC.1